MMDVDAPPDWRDTPLAGAVRDALQDLGFSEDPADSHGVTLEGALVMVRNQCKRAWMTHAAVARASEIPKALTRCVERFYYDLTGVRLRDAYSAAVTATPPTSSAGGTSLTSAAPGGRPPATAGRGGRTDRGGRL